MQLQRDDKAGHSDERLDEQAAGLSKSGGTAKTATPNATTHSDCVSFSSSQTHLIDR